jgi:two-component system, OmpR family, sensor kinase
VLSIKAKIVIAYTVVFGIVLAGFAWLTYETAYDNEIAKMDARLESHADKLATELEENSRAPGFPSRSVLDPIQTGGLPDVKVRLLVPDKRIVWSDSGFALGVAMRWNEGTDTIMHKGTVKMATGKHRKYRIMQWPVEIDNRFQYVMQVATSMKEIEDNLSDLRMLFFVLIPVGLLFSGFAAYWISVLAFKPMMNMVKKAGTISAQTLDARLDLPSVKDEVHQLGSALNGMIDRIDLALKSQRQFIADASHEIRTPLTIIRTELELALRHVRTRDLKSSLATSLGELDHLSGMVNDLLVLARLDGGQPASHMTTVRLDEVIVECVQAVKRLAEKKRVKLKLFVGEAVEVPGEHKKLMSVFLNLLDNAIKYSPKNKVVSVVLAMKDDAANIVCVSVKDEGPGIPETERERVFTRFFRGAQSRSASEGSGLGLAIAHRMVELHGGRITLQSIEGKGSTFTVELPIAAHQN